MAGGLFLYLLFHVTTLVSFPFVHSDEVWLATLTRDMIAARSPAATESFFRLTPRWPHAAKTLYHLLQVPFVAVSFSPGSVRLLSVALAMTTLYFFRRTLDHLFDSGRYGRAAAVAWTCALALDVQFVYAAHLARQEIAVMTLTAAAIAWVVCGRERWNLRRTAALGSLLGVSVAVHPNAALVAVAVAPLLAATQARRVGWRGALRHGAAYAAAAAGGAGLVALASFAMDGAFLEHYAAFGDAVGVGDHPARRWARFLRFWRKLYVGAAGTYYLPPVRVQLVALAVTPAAAVVIAAASRRRRGPGSAQTLLGVLGVVLCLVAGLFALGKFSPLSVSLLWPPAYLLAALCVDRVVSHRGRRGAPGLPGGIGGRCGDIGALRSANRGALRSDTRGAALIPAPLIPAATGAVLAVLTLTGTVTALADMPEGLRLRDRAYRAYETSLREAVPPGSRVLANLNAGFALDNRDLYVYRDLDRLPTGGSIERYLDAEEITYVALPSELDRIYRERPLWNDVYGNLYPYYTDLMHLLERRGRVAVTFETPYAMRLLPYLPQGPHSVTVYRLDPGPIE